MKRSRNIRLVLLGGLSAGTLAGCNAPQRPSATAEDVYTNNYFLPGVGYYHAPFRAWYTYPYNHFNAEQRIYFYGGQWGPEPHRSITNISSPTVEAAQVAQATRSDVPRGGFGSTSQRHFLSS